MHISNTHPQNEIDIFKSRTLGFSKTNNIYRKPKVSANIQFVCNFNTIFIIIIIIIIIIQLFLLIINIAKHNI